MEYEPHDDFKPRPGAVVALSIGYGAINVVIDDTEVEFVPVLNSGEPECTEIWNDLRGENHG
jgi:hypothetical protein